METNYEIFIFLHCTCIKLTNVPGLESTVVTIEPASKESGNCLALELESEETKDRFAALISGITGCVKKDDGLLRFFLGAKKLCYDFSN